MATTIYITDQDLDDLSRLLFLYRMKRCVDGMNGRTWDAILYCMLDDAIDEAEPGLILRKLISPITYDEVKFALSDKDENMDKKEDGEEA